MAAEYLSIPRHGGLGKKCRCDRFGGAAAIDISEREIILGVYSVELLIL
jgi:hypothetical protein